MIPEGFIYTTPGFTDEKIWLFEARGLVPSREFEKDADEVIEVIDVTKDEMDAMVENGTICDAKTICLIHRCRGKHDARPGYRRRSRPRHGACRIRRLHEQHGNPHVFRG